VSHHGTAFVGYRCKDGAANKWPGHQRNVFEVMLDFVDATGSSATADEWHVRGKLPDMSRWSKADREAWLKRNLNR
jgi:hypothetical protein